MHTWLSLKECASMILSGMVLSRFFELPSPPAPTLLLPPLATPVGMLKDVLAVEDEANELEGADVHERAALNCASHQTSQLLDVADSFPPAPGAATRISTCPKRRRGENRSAYECLFILSTAVRLAMGTLREQTC